MPRFPGYGLPFQYYKPYRKNNYYNNYVPHTPPPEPVIPSQEIPPPPKPAKSLDPVWLDLFGI